MEKTNNITELVFILDRSGSMEGLEGDTIGGFNAMVKKQKKQAGTCLVTTYLFDSEATLLHDRLPIEELPLMTREDYTVGGCTALLDTVGQAVEHITGVHRYIRSEDRPHKTIVVITTDGQENASRRFTAQQVKTMIRQKQEQGWEFLFIGANMDAVETASGYGIGADHAVNYCPDAEGTRAVYQAIDCAVCEMRESKPLSHRWKDAVTPKKKGK